MSGSGSEHDVIRVDERWYVLASSSRTDDRTRVLKAGDTFAVFDRFGDIHPLGLGEQGIFHEGTRFLSWYELTLNGKRPTLLNSTIQEDNSQLTVDVTTPNLYRENALAAREGTVHLFRGMLLEEAVHHEHLRLTNYGDEEAILELELAFGSDYADIFEVRGQTRPRRGIQLETEHGADFLVLGYRGLDGVVRRTRVAFCRAPDVFNEARARFHLRLAPHSGDDLYLTIACHTGDRAPAVGAYDDALIRYRTTLEEDNRSVASVFTSNEQFNDWINRSAADLYTLITPMPEGAYPYAGVPWFSTPFGRDGIITALEYLWLHPGLGRGVLAYLAATQASEVNADQDAEPGKILHETRKGEMAALGEVPFRRYYGTVDATPLFVMLAGAYFERTGDRPFVEGIWPNIERAMEWIDRYGDVDGDGFVEYTRHSRNGLVQQGWKDSDDSVFHADGTLVGAPVALCEVQGYVYQAKVAAARLAERFGDRSRAQVWRKEAVALKARFNQVFWCEEIGTYALALDGAKRPCAVRSSNAGHALFCGVADVRHARRVAEALLSEASFTGWGVRTLASSEAHYNPMSYHNGSVWPHDNALIAAGLARYGFKHQALRVLTGLFNASIVVDMHRLPELFCGFPRIPGQGPTLYPVACSPQAWASGAAFLVLQAVLGLEFSADKPQLCFRHPQLPDYLHEVHIRNLRLGAAVVDLALTRHAHDVGVNVVHKEGDVEVAVVL